MYTPLEIKVSLIPNDMYTPLEIKVSLKTVYATKRQRQSLLMIRLAWAPP